MSRNMKAIMDPITKIQALAPGRFTPGSSAQSKVSFMKEIGIVQIIMWKS